MKPISRFNESNTGDGVAHRLCSLQTPGIVVCLALVAFLCTSRLFMSQSLPIAHDMVFHVFQADQFARAIDGGAMLPRWAMSSNGGYGSPNFIFYAPLGYYLVALIHLVVPSVPAAMVLAIWCSFFFSGMSMFAATKRITGESGSLAAAVIYQLLPFHLLDLYLRGTFSELLAFVWFPLVLLFLHDIRISDGDRRASVGLSIAYAGLILTHLVSGFMFTLVMALYVLWHYVFSWRKKFLFQSIFFIIIGLGLASFYLIPAVFERKYVHIAYVYQYGFSDFRKNFLLLPEDFRGGAGHFKPTLDIVALMEFALCALLSSRLIKIKDRAPGAEHFFFIILFLAAFLLATPLSGPLWEILPGFATLQFPWRWMIIMELALCFLVGASFPREGNKGLLPGDGTKRMACFATGALLTVSLVIIARSGKIHSEEVLAEITDPERVANYTNLPKEYTPIWASDPEKTSAAGKGEKVSLLSGAAKWRIIAWRPEKRVLDVEALAPSRLRLSTFYYPGWEVTVDGREEHAGQEGSTGAIIADIPEGRHILSLRFADTPLRLLAKYASVASTFFLLLISLFQTKDLRQMRKVFL